MKPTVRSTCSLIWIAAVVSLIAGMTSSDALAAGQEAKRVFVFNSYHRGYPFSDNEMRGIDETFIKSGIRIETYVTYMDMKRIPPTPQSFLQLKELIREGYKGVRFDTVIVCDNDALEFMRKYRDELFPGVPVVFTAINDFNEQMLDGRKDITGIIESTDYAGTISIALKLRPETKNIVVVTDDTTTGKAHRSEIGKIRHAFPQSLAFTYLSLADMTLDELAQKLSKLNSDSIVLLLHHFVDRNGTSHTIRESALLLAKRSSVPVFVATDSRMGLGVLGGLLINGYHQGEAAAEMVITMLRGADVSSIPVLLKSPNKYMFDYTVMKRFNISESDLPQGSIVINKPVSMLDNYRPHLFAILGAFIVLCGFVVYLLLEIRKRRKIEKALTLTRVSVEAASDALFWMTPAARIVDVNDAASRMLGYTREELLQLCVPDVDVHFNAVVWQQHFPELRQHGTLMFESEHRTKGGRVFPVEIVANYVRNGDEEYNCSFVRDITERKRAQEEKAKLEAQLQQSQKMESIGTLAGGVAHDFNNILTAIIGYGEMTLMKMAPDDPLRMNIEQMLQASDRAVHLTRDLLLFSRKQPLDRKPVDLNEVILKLGKFLVRVIGEDIAFKTLLSGGTIPILADEHQISQVLMNLATNARDAMPKGGIFTITTEQVQLDAVFTSKHGLGMPGNYAMISVSDTGYGMDEETRQHSFEPFYTTKEVGKGTGLGLAVVYGIIKQHEGHINIYSEPGHGTTFRIYLPVIATAVAGEKVTVAEEHPVGGTETILLAEDNESVRNLSVSVLTEFGYTVITAVDGEEAVNKYHENKDVIQLLLFDLIMPKKSGKEAYDEIRHVRPDIKAIFASGYSPDMARDKTALGNSTAIVCKPISPKELLKKVRDVLDDGKR